MVSSTRARYVKALRRRSGLLKQHLSELGDGMAFSSFSLTLTECCMAFITINWLGSATLVGSGGWSVFKFLFFGPQGILYGVENGRFHKRGPPKHAGDSWLG